MKFALALTAATAFAAESYCSTDHECVNNDDWSDYWNCDGLMYAYDVCHTWVWPIDIYFTNGCQVWSIPYIAFRGSFNCDEIYGWKDDGCLGEWIWEDCSLMRYARDYCTDDCGFWYQNTEGYEFWVTCDEFSTWDHCNGGGVDNCYGDWIWEECSGQYYANDYCRDDCGWWYSDNGQGYWITCDQKQMYWGDSCNGGGIEDSCQGDWIWEECSGLSYAVDSCTDDCGWWYQWEGSEFWVTCDEYSAWPTCNGGNSDDNCKSDWIWEECSGMYYANDYCSDDCGWWYFDEMYEFWVTCDDFYSWESCW